ncbi:DUF2971 domain-containing protein [Pseudomonas fortuita]|uniref:DUF2971 domain-containing protein n=1 Tax=Pseudomonas fortuita TaxID=3233375 RepID=UPI003DA142A5
MITPPYLYKYQSVTQHSLLSLVQNTVWMSTPASFNDPFDCAINLDSKKLAESVSHAVGIASQGKVVDSSLEQPKPEDEAAYLQLRESLRAQMQSIGVLCLSETPDEILMWSHYAENHKGFCVEYRVDDACVLKKLAQPVRYTDTYPSLSLKNLPGDAEENFIDVCVHTKAKQWSYEREWRALAPTGGKLYQAPAQVSAIIFGARMSGVQKREIHELLRFIPGIEFREAYVREDVFGLGMRPYEMSRLP